MSSSLGSKDEAMDKLHGRKTLAVGGILDEFEKDALKREIDIVSLFASFGVALEKKGPGYMGRCPWHDDSTPSLSVDKEKGLYHCFGCGEAGDAFSLVQKMKGCDFKGSLAFLKEFSRSPNVPKPVAPKVAPPREQKPKVKALADAPLLTTEEAKVVPSPAPEAIDAIALLADVQARYIKALIDHAPARQYLASRGLDNPELIEAFHVGYSDGALPSALSEAQRTTLTGIGILTEKGREHFERSITIPLFNERGQIRGFYGRKIDASQPAHLYKKGKHEGIVHREAARVYRDELVLTESVIDALSLYALGVLNVIPCYGVHGFTPDHEALLKDERVSRVVIAFDADEAGQNGAKALANTLAAKGIEVRIASCPSGKDWNEFLCSGGSSDDAKHALAEAEAFLIPITKPKSLALTKECGRYLFTRDELRYKLSGVREGFQSSLRVGVRIEYESRSYVDTVDLYSSRSRASFSVQASQIGLESSRVEADLVRMLDILEAERDERLMVRDEGAKELTEEEREIGMQFLTDPELFDRIVDDLSTLGYVGEDLNKLLVYLAASSRKLDDPISVIVSSQSAAGKSFLIDTVKRCMPEEDVISMTSLSDQALNYLPDDALLHKFLIMGEAVHSESVEHQIREMLSAKELARLVTVKDEKTGEMVSKLVRKDVLVSMVMSTTSADVNPENASRCFVVAADESEGQTKAIFASQRRKYSLERLTTKDERIPEIIARHKAAQRLLAPRAIVNPYASLLDFPARLMRTRRDHERFLDLIACVCFLRQYQKPEFEEAGGFSYIECDIEDYRIAYALMSAILPLTLSNFPAAAEALYEDVRSLIKAKAAREDLAVLETEVTQREIREATGISQMSVKRTMRTLVEYEFLISTGSGHRGARQCYRLVRDEACALVDLSSIPTPEALDAMVKENKSGS
jgi:DNA primase catalytic core